MKTLGLLTAIACCTGLTLSASSATILFETGSGNYGGLAGDNTTYLDAGNGSGWGVLANGSSISDNTQGSGLTMTVSAGTGQSLVSQASNDVGFGTSQGSNGWDTGDVIEISFNQAVTLNSIWFNAGGDGRATGITPTVHTTTLATKTGSTAGGNGSPTELVWDDTTVLAAGQKLTLTHNSSDGNTVVGIIGIEVVTIPEPGSLALLGLGGLLVASRRRRD